MSTPSKLYSPGQIFWALVVGGAPASALLLSANYRRLGHERLAKVLLRFGLLYVPAEVYTFSGLPTLTPFCRSALILAKLYGT